MSEQGRTQKRDAGRAQRRARKRNRRRLNVLIAVGSLICVVVAGYLIDGAVYYNKVHGGVSVSGVPMGGLTRDEALSALTRYVNAAQASPITLKSGVDTWTLKPSDVGTEIDIKRAVSDAFGVSRRSNFIFDGVRRLKLYFSGTNVALQGTVDTLLMDDFLGKIAKGVDVPPVNPSLVMKNGTFEVVQGQKGTVVDQPALRQQLKNLLFTLHSTEVTVPMVVKEPSVEGESTQAAVDDAKIMISGSVNLTSGDQGWSLSAEDVAAYMDFKAQEENGASVLVPYLSADKMAPFFDKIAPTVVSPAVDATFGSDGKTAWVIDAIPGKALDRSQTAAALTAAAMKTGGRTAEVAVKDTPASFTTEEAETLGIKDKLASYTTGPYAGTYDRQVNVKITTKYASGVILAPGEEYNFDKQIGERTPERGYRLAKGITSQGHLEDVLGGGICQVSTTLFNAVFEAGLKITERHNHTLFISHYPPGRDATVTGGGYNFRFVNDTEHSILIRGTSDGVITTFSIYGTKDGRKVKSQFSGFTYGKKRPEVTETNTSLGPGTTLVSQPGQSSRSCWVKRWVTYADGTSHVDTFYSEWPEFPKVTDIGVGSTTTTAGKSTTTRTTTKPKSTTTAATEF